MNVLHVNSQDDGGAAIASLNLHNSLIHHGINSRYLAMDNNYNFDGIDYIFPKVPSKLNVIYLYKRHLIQQFFRRKNMSRLSTKEHISFPYSNIDITRHKLYKDSDIIHLHNIAEFIDIPSFIKKNTKPIVVTLHDLYFLNGIFHIYEKSDLDNKAIAYLEKYKKMMEEMLKFDIKIIAPSNSVKKAAFRLGSHFTEKIEIIYHGIDHKKFKKINKDKAKEILGIDLREKVILIVTDDLSRKNKNFKTVLDKLSESTNANLHILAIGNNYNLIKNPKLSFTNLDFSQNHDMSNFYSASDLTIVPSLFETFSMVTLESIICGTPVIAFDNSGPSEIITHKTNGYLAKFEDYEDFLDGIKFCLDNFEAQLISELDEEFNLDYSTNKYIEVYKSLV